MEFITEYRLSVLIIGLVGLLQFIQLLVVDVIALRDKHTPGYPIPSDHGSVLFRANRAFMNTNESISIYVLFVLFAMFSQADTFWLNTFSVMYLAGRLLHMLCYYFDIKLARSIAFGISLISLLGLFVIGIYQWF